MPRCECVGKRGWFYLSWISLHPGPLAGQCKLQHSRTPLAEQCKGLLQPSLPRHWSSLCLLPPPVPAPSTACPHNHWPLLLLYGGGSGSCPSQAAEMAAAPATVLAWTLRQSSSCATEWWHSILPLGCKHHSLPLLPSSTPCNLPYTCFFSYCTISPSLGLGLGLEIETESRQPLVCMQIQDEVSFPPCWTRGGNLMLDLSKYFVKSLPCLFWKLEDQEPQEFDSSPHLPLQF